MEQNKAMNIMKQGHGCSESVLLAVSQEFGIENDVIPKIASCFAGGIGNSGSVCGAVTGAVMAIGLIAKEGESMDDYLKKLSMAQEFRQRFEYEMKTINCHELTGADLTTPDGIDEFMKSDIPQKVCFPAVGKAFNIVMDILKNT
jgi:C_GCAxxG_C_C family probable redox protein